MAKWQSSRPRPIPPGEDHPNSIADGQTRYAESTPYSGRFPPCEIYILSHQATIQRMDSRGDIMNVVQVGCDNWEMRFPGKVDGEGALWVSDW